MTSVVGYHQHIDDEGCCDCQWHFRETSHTRWKVWVPTQIHVGPHTSKWLTWSMIHQCRQIGVGRIGMCGTTEVLSFYYQNIVLLQVINILEEIYLRFIPCDCTSSFFYDIFAECYVRGQTCLMFTSLHMRACTIISNALLASNHCMTCTKEFSYMYVPSLVYIT